MKILALEFSSAQKSVAVAGNDRALVETIENRGRGTNALAMVDEALREAGLEREQIECLAVGLGPGSYTGIRTAIAFAQGWQLARDVKLLGISSAECLAAQAQRDGMKGRVNVLIDAQREEFYVSAYRIGVNERREIVPLKLAGRNAVAALEEAGGISIGPEVTRWFPAGRILFPRAAILAELASCRSGHVPGEKLEPIYLRETNFVKARPPRFF